MSLSVEYKKKSNSISSQNLKNTQKTIARKSKNSQISASRSVAAFTQTGHLTTRNQRNDIINNQIFLDNNRHYLQNNMSVNNKKRITQNNHNNSLNSYKQAIQKRKKKSIINKNYQSAKVYEQQLLNTIDNFQQTLCSLPLDRLILSQNPLKWLNQQVCTLQKLKEKFNKITNNLKQDTQQYYVNKIQNIGGILKNIGQNLFMLNKMDQLKDYTSGGISHQSRNSNTSQNTLTRITSSSSSILMFNNQNNKKRKAHQKIQYIHNKFNNQSIHNKINNNKNQKTLRINEQRNFITDSSDDKQYYQNNQNYIYKQNNIRLSNQQNKLISVSNYLNQKNKQSKIKQQDNFILKEKQNLQTQKQNNQILQNCQTLRSSYQQHQQNLNKKYSKQLNPFQSINCQLNDKSFLKKGVFNKNQTHLIQQNSNFNEQFDARFFLSQQFSKQTLNTVPNQFSNSSVFGQQTKRTEMILKNQKFSSLVKQIQSLQGQISQKNEIIIKFQQKHNKTLNLFKQQFNKKQKQYLQTIYQLKTQNQELKKAIKQIMHEYQQKYNYIEINKQQLQKKDNKIKQLQQNKLFLQQSLSKISQQIKQYKIRQDQLRQTVKLERQRTKKQQNKYDEITQQVNSKYQIITDLKQDLLKQKQKISILNNQLGKLNKQQQKFRQKQQIYKQKYFKLSAQYDKFKQKINQDTYFWSKICLSCKKQYKLSDQSTNFNDKSIQLRQLINFHKKRLIS